jgi:hypothetical protein
MIYPSIEEVNVADQMEVCRWYRFLSSPVGELEIVIMDRIVERYDDFEGMTPEISKQIGWG